jgi:hypothetical protein
VSLIILAALAYLVSPVLLICGWAQWVRLPKLRTATSILSAGGFVLATTSALLAMAAIVYAQIHHFPYWDPLLLRIYRTGFLLSLGGIVFRIGGIWRPSPVRWYAPTSGVATLAFWVLAAASE